MYYLSIHMLHTAYCSKFVIDFYRNMICKSKAVKTLITLESSAEQKYCKALHSTTSVTAQIHIRETVQTHA